MTRESRASEPFFRCSPRLCKARLSAHTMKTAVSELSKLLEAERIVPRKAGIVSKALEREQIMTTHDGDGIVFPRAYRVLPDGVLPVSAIGFSTTGIEWYGNIVHLVVLSVLGANPPVQFLDYSRALSKTDVSKLCRCKTDVGLWRSLKRSCGVVFAAV